MNTNPREYLNCSLKWGPGKPIINDFDELDKKAISIKVHISHFIKSIAILLLKYI
jgi:hypothetical protein